jgi:O-Antigen ligase
MNLKNSVKNKINYIQNIFKIDLLKVFIFLNYLLISTFFFERIPSIETAFGPIRLYNLVIPLLVILFIYLYSHGLIKINDYKFNYKLIFLGLFVLLGSFSFFNVLNLNRFLAAFISVIFCFSSTFIISTFKFDSLKIIKLFVYLFIAQFIFSAYQFIGDRYFHLPAEITGVKPMFQSNVFGIPRIHNTYNEPSYYANSLFLGIFMFLFLACSKVRIFTNIFKISISNNILFAIFSVISLLIFILTLAKSAWIILPIPLIIVLILVFNSITKTKIKILLIGLVMFCFVGLFTVSKISPKIFSNISGQFSDTVDGNTATSVERTSYSLAAQQLIPQYLFQGIGPGQFGTYAKNNIIQNLFPLDQSLTYPYQIYKPKDNYLNILDTEKNIVFNVYLEVLLEYGLLAFILFMTFLVLLIKDSYKFLSSEYLLQLNPDNILQLSLLMYIICSLGQFMFISPVYINPFFVAIGLLISIQNYKLNKKNI